MSLLAADGLDKMASKGPFPPKPLYDATWFSSEKHQDWRLI